MTFTWTPDLAVGIDLIDEQHRELFRRAGCLLASARAGDEPAEILRVLGYLGEYVATHFRAEEALMADAAYPAIAAHRGEHARLTARFRRMRDGFARGGVGPELADEVRREVCEWLRDHVSETDRALARHLRSPRSP
jgi:hemerythrin